MNDRIKTSLFHIVQRDMSWYYNVARGGGRVTRVSPFFPRTMTMPNEETRALHFLFSVIQCISPNLPTQAHFHLPRRVCHNYECVDRETKRTLNGRTCVFMEAVKVNKANIFCGSAPRSNWQDWGDANNNQSARNYGRVMFRYWCRTKVLVFAIFRILLFRGERGS